MSAVPVVQRFNRETLQRLVPGSNPDIDGGFRGKHDAWLLRAPTTPVRYRTVKTKRE